MNPRPTLFALLTLVCAAWIGCADDTGYSDDANNDANNDVNNDVNNGVNNDENNDVNNDANNDVGCTSDADCAVDEACVDGVCELLDIQTGRFERFTLSIGFGPCPPEMDCSGSKTLIGDGTFMVDRTGEPGQLHEALVGADDLARAVAVLTDAPLVAMLGADEAPCDPPTDIFESMRLEIDGVVFENATTTCQDPPLAEARRILQELEEIYIAPVEP